MQLTQPNYQVTAEEAVTRDIAQQYIKIQQNTQYLTNIVRHQQGRAFKLFNYDMQNIELKSFFNLIVQSAYLLYTCCIKKVALFFSKNLFLAFQKDGLVQVICEFILEQEYLTYNDNKKKQVQQNFNYLNPFKYENAYAQNTLTVIKGYLGVVREYLKKQKDKKFNPDKNYVRQLDNLENAVSLLVSILPKGIKPKTLICCLEQTQVFRFYSYLLKTLNSSLYEVIRKTGNFQQIIQQIKRKEIIFSERFTIMAQQNAVEYEFLESSLEDFIKYMKMNGLVNVQVSVNSGSNSENSRDRHQLKLGSEQIYKHGDRAYNCKILIQEKRLRDFDEKVLLQLTEGDTTTISSAENERKHQNLFYIDYMANLGLISVEYISNIEVNIQNVDALIYHCNNLMMELNNIKVEQIERQSNKNKRKQKLLSFKIITHLNIKESPFINLMLLIDRAMIYGKVCEPEITKKTIRVQDYSRFSVVGKRISHLSNLFIKKIRRLYENIGIKYKQN